MNYRFANWAFAMAMAMLLAACAGPVPKIDLAANVMNDTRTISVIRPPEPKAYAAANFGHGGFLFGFVGGLIAAADINSKQEQLSKAYKDIGVSVSSELAQKISDRLHQLGFDARVEDGPWEEVDGKYLLSFKKINSDADAVMVVSPTAMGFISTGVAGGYNNDYLPTIAAVVVVFGKDREKPIYRGYHVTGVRLKAEGWQYSPPATTFPDFDSLYTDPRTSSASLVQAADKIADSIASDLRRQMGLAKAGMATTGKEASAEPAGQEKAASGKL